MSGRLGSRLATLALAGLLPACATLDPAPAPPQAATEDAVTRAAAALPADAAGFRRGASLPLAGARPGTEVAYATAGRMAAAAIVQLVVPSAPVPNGPDSAAARADFDTLVQQLLHSGTPGRRLAERRRFETPQPNGLLRCVELDGTYGRQPVEGLACAGAVGGRLLRIRVTMPRRSPPIADAPQFVGAILAALG